MTCRACGYSDSDPLPTGRVIRERRIALGLTVDQLIERSEIDHHDSWFYHLELQRKSAPAMCDLAPLCRVLGIDPTSAALGKTVLTGPAT